jgi:acyl-CoA thioester hydrolase
MSRVAAPVRTDYRHFAAIQTRWSDNDMFGHINNVEYYRFFEMSVTDFLMGPCGLDLMTSPCIPFAAESLCRFRRPLSWPEPIAAGLRIEKLGRTSVTYGIGLFGAKSDDAAAEGHWVHVFVDRTTQQPMEIPDYLRQVFAAHMVAA